MPDVTKMKSKRFSEPATSVVSEVEAAPVQPKVKNSSYKKLLIATLLLGACVIEGFIISLYFHYNDLLVSQEKIHNDKVVQFETKIKETQDKLDFYSERSKNLENELSKIKSFGCFAANGDFVKNGKTVTENNKSFKCEQGFWTTLN